LNFQLFKERSSGCNPHSFAARLSILFRKQQQKEQNMLTSSPLLLHETGTHHLTMHSKAYSPDKKLFPAPLSQACYLPVDYSVAHIPSATATPIEFGDDYSTPMFIEAVICSEFDPFIDSESEIAQADAIHEATADEIQTCDVAEYYDAVVVEKDDKYDPFSKIQPEFSNDDLLFAEIIDDLAISGFEEEKDDFTSISPTNLPNLQDSFYPSIFLDDTDSDPNISFNDFSLETEPGLTFSIGGPKPTESSTQMLPANKHLSQTTKQQISTPPVTPHSSPRYPPKPVRERDQSQQKWKDKRVQTLNEARALDARQIATSKRERSNGKFAKRKINWVSITEMV
jgi:hypothetical protein